MPDNRARILTSRDRLNNADRGRVARLMVSLFDRVSLHPLKEEQLLALAGAFVLLADAAKIPAQDVFTAVKNLMTDRTKSEGLVLQFSAMKYHLETEVLA